MRMEKWGGFASFVMAAAIVAAHWYYLTGNLGDAVGRYAYSLADVLYGPVWGVCLVTAVYALREQIGRRAPRLMTLALVITLAAACTLVTVAAIRSANRYYHIMHPYLNLENSTMVLTVWATLVMGMIGAAFHFLGWSLALIGIAGWTTGRLPRPLSVLYLVAGLVSLGVIVNPALEGTALALVLALSLWQGIVLWRADPEDLASARLSSGMI